MSNTLTTTKVMLSTMVLATVAFLSSALTASANTWVEASSTALVTSAISSLSSALYNILVIIIPVAVAVGIFFFAYAWVRGVFRNRR